MAQELWNGSKRDLSSCTGIAAASAMKTAVNQLLPASANEQPFYALRFDNLPLYTLINFSEKADERRVYTGW